MNRLPKPLFVARQNYWRRRATDASRLLPFVGAFLFAFPILWSRPSAPGTARPGLAEQGLYVFAVWLGLSAIAGIVAWRLRGQRADRPDSANGPGAEGDSGGPAGGG